MLTAYYQPRRLVNYATHRRSRRNHQHSALDLLRHHNHHRLMLWLKIQSCFRLYLHQRHLFCLILLLLP